MGVVYNPPPRVFCLFTNRYDRVVVYSGTPGVECTAGAPQRPVAGFNEFLKHLDVTFRRDPTNFRPRINKKGSAKDQKQKAAGTYYTLDDADED